MTSQTKPRNQWEAEVWKHPDGVAESLLVYAYGIGKKGMPLELMAKDILELYTAEELATLLAVIATRFNWKRL